jgi:hypothetical protein
MSIAWLGEKRVGRFAGLKVKGLEGGRGSDQEKSKTPHAKTAYGAPGSRSGEWRVTSGEKKRLAKIHAKAFFGIKARPPAHRTKVLIP